MGVLSFLIDGPLREVERRGFWSAEGRPYRPFALGNTVNPACEAGRFELLALGAGRNCHGDSRGREFRCRERLDLTRAG